MSLRSLAQIQSLISMRTLMTSAVSAYAIWFPSKTDYYEFVYVEEGMSISISQNSPPRALLEDEFIAPIETLPAKLVVAKPGQILLQSGIADVVVNAQSDSYEIARVQRALTKNFVPKTAAQVAVAQEVSVKEIVRQMPTITFFAAAAASQMDVATNEKYKGATSGDAVPSFGEAFKNTTKIINDQDKSPQHRDPEADDDLTIAMAGPIPKFPSAAKKSSSNYQSLYASYASPSNPENTRAAAEELGHEIKEAKVDNARTSASQGQLLMDGTIELSKGLALVDGASLSVFHEVSGQSLEQAQIYIKEARYEIFIQDRSVGALVGEVRDQDQMLLGKVEIPLDEIDYSNMDKGIRKTLNLKMQPVATSIEGNVKSIYSNGVGEADADILVSGFHKNVVTNKAGRFSKPHILHNSQVLVSAKKIGHWNSLIMTDNNRELELKLFPDKMIQALAQLTEAEKNYGDLGIIWGRIENGGKPEAGATVESTSADAIGPIYFNALQLPDLDMKETGSNGLFAFIQVDPGFQIVRAKNKGRVFPAKAAVVERGSVSQLTIEVTNRKTARAMIFDAFTGVSLEADLQFSGTDKSAHTAKGLLGIKYHLGRDLMFLEADSTSEYLPVRQTLSRDISYINFPMLKRAFVDDLLNSSRINRIPQTGMVVGFIRGSDYEVLLPDGSASEIIYFNSEGKSVGSQMGVKDGGFILINLNPGVQTIAIAPKDKKALVLKLIYAEPTRTSLINYRF